VFPSPSPETGRRSGDRAEPDAGRERRAEPGGEDGAGAPASVSEVAPIRRPLALSIAGFAGLLGVGLVFGAQTAGPGSARIPFAVVLFGVQLLFVLAWCMAMRPPALPFIAGVSVAVAAAADVAAVRPRVSALAPLLYLGLAGLVAGVLGQLVRRVDRRRVTESLGATLLIVAGVVSFATLVLISRRPGGTQAIFVCLTAATVALVVARVLDAVLPSPRLAAQVPRGAAGVVAGAMSGTLASAVLGSFVWGFTPRTAAVGGLVAAGVAVLVDLAADYVEAGRRMAGEPPTMWLARHMQGPLGGFALAAPATYVVTLFVM
jgi:FtsH-binding integral membrane protein